MAVFISRGSASMLVSMSTGSRGFGPVRRMRPRLSGRTTPTHIVQPNSGMPARAASPGDAHGTGKQHTWMSGVSSAASDFQKNVVYDSEIGGDNGSRYSQLVG